MLHRTEVELTAGMIVRDMETGKDCKIEKIDPAGFVVLDETFGASTSRGQKNHVKWIEEHGSDGRYSVSVDELSRRIQISQTPKP